MANKKAKDRKIPYSKQELLATGPQRTFTGRQLDQIAFPIGGIGTGSISLNGHGALQDWELFNRPGKGNRPACTFFILWAKQEGEESVTKVLEARPNVPFSSSHGYPREYGAGLPHMAKALFEGAYPFANITFKDPDMPLKVSLEAFNPFIPLNPEDSGLPVVILKYTLKNRSKKPVDASLSGSLLNFVGYNNEGALSTAGAWFGKNVNEIVREESFAGLRMTTQKYEEGHPQFGSVALVTTEQKLTFQTRWSREGWFDTLQRFWDQFSANGTLTDDDSVDPSPDGRTDIGSIGVKVHLEPGENVTDDFQFLVLKYFQSHPPFARELL